MTALRYLTRKAVDDLRDGVGGRLDWYYAPDGTEPPPPLAPDMYRVAKIRAEPLAGLERGRAADAANALLVYRALDMLTPQQASDERFWAYVSHYQCADYVADRWLGERPADDGAAARKAANHFFARDIRAAVRDHGVSRLWWLGRIANDTHPADPALFLEIVLHRQDVRSALIERPGVSANRDVLRGIFAVMREHWEGERALFRRGTFRAWMVGLNRRGGVALLDALPEDALASLLREEAERALKAAAAREAPPAAG